MVSYGTVKNADVDVLMTEMGTLDVAITRIVTVFHDGTQYIGIYVI